MLDAFRESQVRYTFDTVGSFYKKQGRLRRYRFSQAEKFMYRTVQFLDNE